ncbi:MAG: hypothetical protein NT138_09070 [Planctomycetales bacterium]|nr:hypothetical protein [Planctomycetales bacterium]
MNCVHLVLMVVQRSNLMTHETNQLPERLTTDKVMKELRGRLKEGINCN